MDRETLARFGSILVLLVAGSWGEPLEGQVIASGQFVLHGGADATSVTGDKFRTVAFQHTIPPGLGPTAGRQMAVHLQDLTQLGLVCTADHPVSGCATVDWTMRQDVDFPNRVVAQTTTGTLVLHLRLNDSLSLQPEPEHPE